MKLLQGIKNIWYWLPIIWQDRQWDYYYLLAILEHKLRAMEQFFGSDSIDPNKRIAYCRMLTTRLIQDNYIENALRFHKQIYGQAELIFREDRIVTSAVPHLVGKEREIEQEKRYRLYEIARRQEHQDLDVLFAMLRKYIQHW